MRLGETSVAFQVFDVSRPVASTMRLAEQGFRLSHSSQGHFLEKRHHTAQLFEEAGLPLLELRVDTNSLCPLHDARPPPQEEFTEWFKGDDDDMMVTSDAWRARGIFIPHRPSATERAQHNLRDWPYISRCRICKRGRGKESPHLKKKPGEADGKKIPMVQVDDHFMHTASGKDKMSVVTMVDTETGATVASIAAKQGQDTDVQRVLPTSLGSFGRTGGLVIQGDGEPSLVDLLQRVVEKSKCNTMVRRKPTRSRAFNADIEGM